MGKMTKSDKKQQKTPQSSKKSKGGKYQDVPMPDMDDEIDTFHKKRDMIPLDMNDDTDTDDDDDKDMEVFDYEGIDGEDDDEDEDDEDEDEDDDEDDYSNERGLAGKIARQLKYLKEKTGGGDDDLQDNSEEDENKETHWIGRNKYEDGAGDECSDEETLAEVEEEAKRMLKEKAKSMREEDFGLPTVERDGSDAEPTLGEIITGKNRSNISGDKEAEGDSVSVIEVKKDLNALSTDEQMDILESSAPELVDLLEELKDAIDQLETQVNPLLGLVRKSDNADKKGMHYLEVKRVLLLAYCQAITFYLLLKSEGQPPHDHPVMGRLDEIKSLLAKMKELDGHLPDGLENILNEKRDIVPAKRPAAQNLAASSDLRSELNDLARFAEKQEVSKFVETAEPVKMDCLEVIGKKRRKDKQQDEQVSRESGKMLQHRTLLEEKLKQRAVSISGATKTDGNKQKKLKRTAGQLQTIDDFDDEAVDLEGIAQGNGRSSSLMSKVSKIITARGKKKLKGVSGDDDLPERDNLGARRLKHEAHILANVGINATDDDDVLEHEQSEREGDDVEDGSDSDVEGGSDSGADYYKLAEQTLANKRRVKAMKSNGNPEELFESEMTVDGKRHISVNMEKNRGLTRQRKKIDKNPRKKYRGKYEKKRISRKGQVRDIRMQTRPYGGEDGGINARVSKSIRL